MAVTLDQLIAFTATVEKGGFRQAGLSIGKHGTSVSQQVANLEIDFDLQLFDRSARAITLTDSGKALYEYAKAVLREVEHFEMKAESLAGGEPTRFTFAIDASLVSAEISDIYRALLDAFPVMEFQILTGDPLQVRQWVMSGIAELGFSMSTFTIPHEIAVARCYAFDVIQIAPRDWGIEDKVMTSQQVRGKRQIGYHFFKQLGHDEAHLMSNQVLFCNTSQEILSQVIAGNGWANLPRFCCLQALADGQVQQFHIGEERYDTWQTELIWQATQPINSAMQLMIDAIQTLPSR
ncbi:hypothetical protein A3K86_18605 [Photobacterium jeanii]|uniref:HTH lysR-type domain-containing protein n=1 Tax=Photobacterium jeanii TaxID=858640 RepID=A0A178K103_9GAMM|nr:LysR family transcriptional regulator [Photobacterium jeanii]OAN10990.1 hypothetical protein A3K86_18605 [Photobacterium jeanii]PST90504.1 LysR family transcriptional regulator [Photobacterium jeanii]